MWEILLHTRLHPNVFDTKITALRKVKIYFLTVILLKFLTFLEKYLTKLEFLDSIEITAWVKISKKNNYDYQKCQLSDLLTVFKNFLITILPNLIS